MFFCFCHPVAYSFRVVNFGGVDLLPHGWPRLRRRRRARIRLGGGRDGCPVVVTRTNKPTWSSSSWQVRSKVITEKGEQLWLCKTRTITPIHCDQIAVRYTFASCCFFGGEGWGGGEGVIQSSLTKWQDPCISLKSSSEDDVDINISD